MLLKAFLTDEAIHYQLVPLGVHQQNAAEQAIRTFQNHFIAGRCSVDRDYPIHLWNHLVTPAELTWDLLRSSRIYPELSAHAVQARAILITTELLLDHLDAEF
jgi:hypothetical protein